MAERYDIIIIGAGPAGMEAALTAKARNKNFLLIGKSGVSEKVSKAHAVKNFLGLPDVTGEQMSRTFLNHLEQAGISLTPGRLVNAYNMGDYYALQMADNSQLECKALIIATGVNFGKALPGEETFLGRGVSYCATCDAVFYKNKKAALVAYSKEAEEEAKFLAENCSQVLYFPQYKEEVSFSEDNIQVIYEKAEAVEGDKKADILVTDKSRYKIDGIFFLRDSVSPAQLVPGLQMDGNHIGVDRSMKTNLKGCFACGDITGTPYQYIKAAGEGNVAALSAVAYLSSL
jgi:thioredoxin reductase (NADPH)